MLTVAYLANQFPSAVEPYVGEEIGELRARGVQVVTGSVRKPGDRIDREIQPPDLVVLPAITAGVAIQAARLLWQRRNRISGLMRRVLVQGTEGPFERLKALLHTFLGAIYAVLLRGHSVDHIHVQHIHVQHGYFGSWVAMTAARLLGIEFSMTLHGSDLLLHGTYLDVKLAQCKFCRTVSEYNRRYILERYPHVSPEKVLVSRLGVAVDEVAPHRAGGEGEPRGRFTLLAVGRLHEVKDHAFLIRACAELEENGVPFECLIAGDGPERRRLRSLIRTHSLEERVTLLGHVAREQMSSLYDRADVVVLTSRSEGIPLVLMEAMARGKIVLAPAITGIPELVIAGRTGFLYEGGSQQDFVDRLLFIYSLMQAADGPRLHPYILSAARDLDWVRHAARLQVRHSFHRAKNLKIFGDQFLQRVTPRTTRFPHENPVLQQIQLPVQRNGSVPVRTDGADALAGTRSRSFFDD